MHYSATTDKTGIEMNPKDKSPH